MRKTITTILAALPLWCAAQAPSIEWQYTYGGSSLEQVSAVRPTFDGGYIVTGFSASTDGDVTGNHGANDHWIIKLDAQGQLQWEKSYGGSGGDQGYDIRQTSDSGYVFIGYNNSPDGDVTGNHGSTDYWLVKIDANGVLQWQRSLGGSSADNGYSVIQTLDGGYAVAGLSATSSVSGDITGPFYGGQDYWFCKLDASGTLQWQTRLGGSSTEQCFGVVQAPDSGYVLCGYSSSPNTGMVTGNHGGNDYWIVKINTSGGLVWQHSYGGSGSDRAFNISTTNDGGYIVNGISPSTDGDVTGNHGNGDYWVIKLDSLGVLQWEKSLGGSGEDFGRSVYQTLDGGYILGGRTNTPNDGDVTGNHGNYDYWVVNLDSLGNINWQQCYGGSDNESAPPSLVPFTNVMQLPDGKYIMAGYTYSSDGDVVGNVPTSPTDDNYWIVKLYPCPAFSDFSATICSGDTFAFANMQLTASGDYYDTLASIGGCDSIVTLHLTALPPITSSMLDTICGGDSLFFNNTWLLNPGIYDDTLVSVNGCDSLVSLNLMVIPIPFTLTQDSICNGDSIFFNNTWISAPGNYVSVFQAVTGCDSIISLALYVHAPVVTPVINASGNNLSTGNYDTYQWLLNGQPINGATNQNYTVTTGGVYTVAVTDSNGCADTSAIHVSTLGSKTLVMENITIFPNPVKETVQISFPQALEEMHIALYGLDGKLLLTETRYNSSSAQLIMNSYSSGVYMLKITDENGQSVVRKITKE